MKSNYIALIILFATSTIWNISAQDKEVSDYLLSDEVKAHIEANQITLPSYQDLEKGLDEAVNFTLFNFKKEPPTFQMSTKAIFEETIYEINNYDYDSVIVSFKIQKVILEDLGPESITDFIGQAEFEMSIMDKKTKTQIETVQKKLSARMHYTQNKNAILISFMGE